MLTEAQYNQFETDELPGLIKLIEHIKTEIQDDYIEHPDDEPNIELTIATNDDLSETAYQTGDNSFTGSCYHYPHWAVSWVYRDSNSTALAKELLSGLTNTVAEATSCYCNEVNTGGHSNQK